MAKVSSVTTIKCDNCGALETREWKESEDNGWSSELPSMTTSTFAYASTYIGRAPDYCPACIEAVRSAIEAAKNERRRANGLPPLGKQS